MGSDVGQIFPTASFHRDHSILYALVCEKEKSVPLKPNGDPRDGFFYLTLTLVMDSYILLSSFAITITNASVDKQMTLIRDYIYKIENTDLEIGVSGVLLRILFNF